MELRVYRTFRWVLAVPESEVRYGGDNPVKLKATDELQYRDSEGAWHPIPVVEAPRPENPREKRRREESERIARGMAEHFKNIKCYTCGEPAHPGTPCAESPSGGLMQGAKE